MTPMDFETYDQSDPIVAAVIRKMYQRSQVGIKKYGTTLEENNEDDFLNHAIEEAMDLILYLTKVKSILEKKGISNLQNIK
jgi:hypothetical protein